MKKYILGIDVGGTNIKAMIMDTDFHVAGQLSIPSNAKEGYEHITNRLLCEIDQLLDKYKILPSEISSVGMGLPGTVDSKNQTSIYLSKLRWDGFNPAEKIGKYFNAPFIIENDANVATFGEYAFGNFGNKDLVLLTLGTGIGGGAVFNGKILGGSMNIGLEIGHMTICADGTEKCLCGKKGHFEAYCSGTALKNYTLSELEKNTDSILNDYIKENNNVFDNAMITNGFQAGDSLCCKIMERYTRYLAIGLVNIMHLFNPEIILLGGGVSNAGKIIIEPVNRLCASMVIHERSLCPVAKTSLGAMSGMYGACALAAIHAGIKLPGNNQTIR